MQPNINNFNSLVRPRSIDQQWLREQLETVIEWALDIATKLALRDPSDASAIDHVRDFIRKYLLGQRAEVPVGDVLTTLGILISGIYIEDERTALSVLAPLRTMLQMPSELPAMLRVRSLKDSTGDDEPAADPVPDGADDDAEDDRDDLDDDLDDDEFEELEELDDVPLRRFHRR